MEGATNIFLEYGLIGAMLVVMGWAYWQERTRANEQTEKRIEEKMQILDSLNDMTNAFNNLTEVVKARNPLPPQLGG
jgi:predicted negative regulator of RcsB-dependent stress response